MLESLTFCFIHDLRGSAAAAHVYLGGRAEVAVVVSAVVNAALDLCLRAGVGAAIGVGGSALALHKGSTVGACGGSWVVTVDLDSLELAKAGAVVCTFFYFTG